MKNKFRMALFSMAAVGLVGCTDKLSDDITQSKDGVTDGCVTFKINAVGNQTRADGTPDPSTGFNNGYTDGFDKGHADESKITTEQGANVVFLFGSNDTYKGRSELQVMSQPADLGSNNDKGHSSNKDGETFFNARIRKTKDEEELKCFMILNAPPSELNKLQLVENTTTLDDFIKETENLTTGLSLGRYTDGDDETYFTMSNTVYVDGSDKKITGPITITDDNIYSTSQDAQDNPVTVHVERLSAKFGLKYGDEELNTDVIEMTKEVTGTESKNELFVRTSADLAIATGKEPWAIKIIGWDVNGTEKKEFWVKNLTTDDANSKPVYESSTGNIGNWDYLYNYNVKNAWNDPSRLRSYWAVDPHYDSASDRYPEQYRNVTGSSIMTGVVDGNALSYITYNQIKELVVPSTGTNGEVNIMDQYRYAPENTFGEYGFMGKSDKTGYSYKVGEEGKNYKRASTHILVAAELLIGEEEIKSGVAGDKYCYENIYWDAKNIKELIKYMMRGVLDEHKVHIYKDDKGEERFSEDDANDYFELTADATIKGGDGRKMLALIKNNANKLYKKDTDGYAELKDADLQDAIFAAGTAKHYNNGKMYYPIYIEHMAPMMVDGDGETHYNIGSYGVVRNHWYNINIKEIKVPGIPVDKPEDPIIPNDDPDEGGYIAFEIVIVPWHVINQNVSFE